MSNPRRIQQSIRFAEAQQRVMGEADEARAAGRLMTWRYRGLGAVGWQVHRSTLSDPEQVKAEILRTRGVKVEATELCEKS